MQTTNDLTEVEKSTLQFLLRQELSKVAEKIHRNQMTLARLNDIYNIEKEDDDKKDEVEQYRLSIKDLNQIIELFQEEFDLLETLQNKIE